MENNYEIYHHGVKGQRWGIRRYQNKDGSLTKLGKKRRGVDDKDEKKETDEEIRARVLKSTNAEEIYKNRHLLTTAEIRERLDRINTEKQLGDKAAEGKTTKMQKLKKAVDTAKEIGDTIETAYQITQKPSMKALMKTLKGETESKEFNADEALKKIDKMSDEEVKNLNVRLKNTKSAYEAAQSIKDLVAGLKKPTTDTENANKPEEGETADEGEKEEKEDK